MKPMCCLILGTVFLILMGCNKGESPNALTLEYDFQDGANFWEGDFADYPVGAESQYELLFEYDSLPMPLDSNQGALKLSGMNRSDDLFMFLRRQVTGLLPNKTYKVSIAIEIASNIPDNQFGIGGSPGESVYIKAGAATLRPEKVIQSSYYRMNIDAGVQSNSGTDMKVIGDFSNDTEKSQYVLKQLQTTQPETVMTDNSGNLWLVIGTDSAYEGPTTIYYNSVSVDIAPQ